MQCLARYGNITAACAQVGIDRGTFYNRRDADAAFAAQVAEALETSNDLLELEARRRAEDGTLRPVFGSGGSGVGTVEVGTIREYSDTLLIFLLKAHRPEKYRERYELKHAGSVNVTMLAEDMTDDELAAIAASVTQ